jgi:hypothetical protein
MNRILTTWGASGQPFTSPTSLDHLQDAFYEGFKEILRGLIGPTYDATKAYAIWGCYYNSSTNSLSEGAIYFENEIWHVDAWVPGVSCGVGTVPCLSKVTTWASTDPLDYKDGSSHNTHRIRKIAGFCNTSGSTDVCDIADLCRVELPKRMIESAGTATAASPVSVNFRQNSSLLYNGITSTGVTIDVDATGGLHGSTAEVIIIGSIDPAGAITLTSSVSSTPFYPLTDSAITPGAGAVKVLFTLVKPTNTSTELITVQYQSQ